jgi:CRP-like cAMP-binding protein
MSNDFRIRILRMTKEFEGSSDAQLDGLLPFFDEVVVPYGTRIAQEGSFGHQFVIVASGELETCRQGKRGRLEPGDTFGLAAMYEQGRYEATVTAMSSARLLVMGHAQFRAVKTVVGAPPEASEPALTRSLVR